MSAQWPRVVARLVALLPTLSGYSGVQVFDGPPLQADTPLYVTVGYVDGESAGTYDQTRTDYQLTESGEVACAFVAQSGDTDLSQVRGQVFALVDALEDSLRADQTLGVLSPDGTCNLTADVQSINSGGAAQVLVVTVSYYTRT